MIVDNTLHVDNLEPLSVLSSTGRVINVEDVDDLDRRPVDITFMKFCCVVDGSNSDK